MPNWYTHRDILKDALGIPATSTGAHVQLDAVIEGVARQFDRHVGFGFFPSSQTRHYTPWESMHL